MNYPLFEIGAILFSAYFFYAAYRGLPSILGRYLFFFGIKKNKATIDKVYNAVTGIFLIVVAIALEFKRHKMG